MYGAGGTCVREARGRPEAGVCEARSRCEAGVVVCEACGPCGVRCEAYVS